MTPKTLLDSLVPFPGQTLQVTPHVSPSPSLSPVYLVSQNHVAKPNRRWLSAVFTGDVEERLVYYKRSIEKEQNRLLHEYTLLHEAHRAGLAVPKPEGLFTVTLYDPSCSFLTIPRSAPTLVMEYLKGTIRLDKIDSKEENIARRKYGAELEKARQLGFEPDDTGYGNALWQPATQRAFMIDLECWRRKRE